MSTVSKITPEQSKSPSSKKFPTAAIVGIGCVILLFIIGIVMTVAGKMLFSTIGQKFMGQGVKNVIEQQSGIDLETNDKGEVVSFKDKTTGEEVSIGTDALPVGFPSDFPLYPGAKSTGSVAGSKQDGEEGFWLLMETGDAFEQVVSFYTGKLKGSGWTSEESTGFGNAISWKLAKGELEGALVVSKGEKNEKKTTILITLSPKSAGDSE